MNYIMNVKIYHGDTLVIAKDFDSFPVVIGRSAQCHLSAPNLTMMSRTHASISIEGNKVVVTDLDSTNGIYANGERSQKIEVKIDSQARQTDLRFEVRLKKNDRIEIVVIDIEVKEAPRVNPVPEPVEDFEDPTTQPTVVVSKKATTPILSPLSKANEASLKPKAVKKVKEDNSPEKPIQHELELTKVSSRLHKAAKKIRIEQDLNLQKLKKNDIGLQGVLTWGEEILDVRQFLPGDELVVGTNPYEPIYIPSVTQRMKFGVYAKGQAKIAIPNNIKWRLAHEDFEFSAQEALQSKLASESAGFHNINLVLSDTCSIDLGMNISLHLRYVQIPRPLVSRSWIENREEFKKAITISAVLHLVVVLIATFSAPKIEAPVVENLPPRYAKLLVEPPPQILVPEPVKPPPPPPPPPVEKKPVEVPKPVVVKVKPKQKPVAKTEKKVESKPAEKKPVSAPPVSAPVAAKPAPVKEPVQAPEPAGPTAQEIAEKQAQEAADSFASAFDDAKPAAAPSASKVNIVSKGAADSGVKTSGLIGSIKTNNAQAGNSEGVGGNALAKAAGEATFAKSGGKAGTRGVGGAVVGTPSFEAPSSPQGLKNDQVMSVVNKYLADIQRCYERALFQDSNLAGRVEYEWEITAQGSVSRTSVKRSEISNGEFLNSCVLAIFKKMKFPAATNKQTTIANIGFPFGKN